jgi:protein-S-isoprenylcysteine O-methyltransferase Ste14
LERQPDEFSPIQSITAVQWGGIVGAYLLVPLILFGIGRDWEWWQAWVFSLLATITGVGGRIAAERRHPGIMAERIRFGRGQDVKRWDRVLAPLMGFSLLYPLVVVAALDHFFGWTTALSTWVNVVALIAVGLGYGLAVWALVENRFFSAMTRIQAERGHEVCDTGPYRYVRHPAYAGSILPLFVIGLALNSWWALVAGLFALAVSVVRTALEDRTLLKELPGYEEYASRVRYRLVPKIW